MSSAGTQATRTTEIRALTGLRIVAALWVVIIHFQAPISQAFGGFVAPVWPLVLSGWMGVDLFFLLSGFVMTVSYLDRIGPRWQTWAVVDFVWARLIRIWPLWALLTTGMFTFLFVVTRHADPAVRPTLGGLLEQLGLVQMWHRDLNLGSSFVPPGWSLSVELLAYLAFPLVVLVLFRLRRLPAVVLAGLAVAAMVPLALIAHQDGLSDYFLPWPVRIAGAFVSGGLTCLAVRKLRESVAVRRVSPLVAVIAVVEIVAICFWAHNRVVAGGPNQLGIAVVFFPVLVGALALSESGLARLLSTEAMVVGGRISFALYLVHYPVLQVGDYVQAQFPALASSTPTGALVQVHLVLVALGLAWVLWRFVEEPARAWLKDRGPSRRRSRRPATVPAAAAVVPQTVQVPEPRTASLPVTTTRAPLAAALRDRPPSPRREGQDDLLRLV